MRREQQVLQRIAEYIHRTKTQRSREATIAVIAPYISVGLNIPSGTVIQVIEEMLSHADIMQDLEQTENRNRRQSREKG
jgi:hypothetical protein